MKGPSENNDLKKKFETYTYPVDDSNWDAISSRLSANSGNGFLGAKFSGFTAQPSSGVWTRIAAEIRPGRKRRLAAWWWYAAAASLLAFAYLGYEFFSPGNADTQLAEKNPATVVQSDSVRLSENDQNADPVLTDTAQINSEPSKEKQMLSDSMKEIQLPKGEQKPEHTHVEALTAETSGDVASENSAGNEMERADPTQVEETINIMGREAENLMAEKNIATDTPENFRGLYLRKLALQNPEIPVDPYQPELIGDLLVVAFAPGNQDEKKQKGTGFYDGTENPSTNDFSLWGGSQIAFAGSGNEDNSDRTSFESTGTGVSYSQVDLTSKEYSPPIYYGINGEIKFRKRLSGGVGIGYLRMQSSSTQYFGSGLHREREITHSYLSVPVYLKFNFIDKPKFAAYTTLGHAFDIMIGQQVLVETYQNAQLRNAESFNDGTKSNQANIYTGLGMHLKFTKNIGVFAEGSLMHYYHMRFDNFFSQQKYWPGLKFGLLFSFE